MLDADAPVSLAAPQLPKQAAVRIPLHSLFLPHKLNGAFFTHRRSKGSCCGTELSLVLDADAPICVERAVLDVVEL